MAQWQRTQALEVLTFGLEQQIFAIEAEHVREILDPGPSIEVPGAQAFVSRLSNVRGNVAPLADLRVRFGLGPTQTTIDTRIILIEIGIDGEPAIVGLMADKVYEVTEIPTSDLEETPRIGLRWPTRFVQCIGKRDDDFIIVLDIERIFSTHRADELDNVMPLGAA